MRDVLGAGCATRADCAKANFAKICKPPQGCVECLADKDCTSASLGSSCSGTICACKADADCKTQLVGHRCDTALRACTCATDADCPAGRTCSGTFITIKICK